jgi:hypothetical protein
MVTAISIVARTFICGFNSVLIMEKILIGTVVVPGVARNWVAGYSSKERVKARSMPPMMPGAIKGKVMLLKVWK